MKQRVERVPGVLVVALVFLVIDNKDGHEVMDVFNVRNDRTLGLRGRLTFELR